MAKLYLIRHAQSANNAIWDGDEFGSGRTPDPEITEIGQQQAAVLAEHLADPHTEPRRHPDESIDQTHFGLSHVYCSLMTRSICTADAIAKACGLNCEALPDVYEKYGIFDVGEEGKLIGQSGPDRNYFETRFPDLKLPTEMNNEGWWSRPAEDEGGFLDRMKGVVSSFRSRLASSNETIALVAHGDFIDQFLNELMGVPRHNPNYREAWVANWSFHNTSISRIDFVKDSHTIVYTNRIDHLTTELVTW
ncbi:MAG: 2,3-bisphosphoglycerate-dependent phosphoglycerate mutase [Gammaproteobacteria bacterium]|jgi:2,3-bisphosphoglycerate-dependent phosphoglycerate mutase